MPREPNDEKEHGLLLHFRNWLSLAGLIVVGGSFFAFLLLIGFDLVTGGSNPYVGILSYIVAPLFFGFGSLLAFVGWLWSWRKRRDRGVTLTFDLSRLKDRRIFGAFIGAAMVFMFATSMGSYQTYTYTSSNQFCGVLCHSVMEPQYDAYPDDVHAMLNCVDCHVGEGAKGAFKAKWHGIYKLYSLVFDKYPKPLRADPHYLPTTQESCNKCHEDGPDFKDVAKTYHHYLSDDENTPFSVTLRLKLGPERSGNYETNGIHWHAKDDNQIEFTTALENPDVIPWIKVTKSDGSVTEYTFTPDEDAENVPDLNHVSDPKTMDCIDCHSRPAHGFKKPNDLVERALHRGQLSNRIPEIKYIVARALDPDYETSEEAHASITKMLRDELEGPAPAVEQAIDTVNDFYANNVFPHMNADWRAYPDYIGHKDTLGCFRCHDDKHSTFDGSKTLSAKNCHTCHDVISQGEPGNMTFANSPETEFDHPDGSYLGFTCAECHTGGLQLE
ncbi:NapC/NirT family cytochrome c [Pelagicoccus sp. SDUM812003]|uniref:NapC/NirT family cytochrome c n=1 Tax=Pelagicoccus sp. SDUM812003 TaxID=3041267 RepID=UPI00280DF98F|nr:NapC/NirT family cytochrome c [Pelagicoccus sp. SDUM812003]MDQ8205060.1 NapC/NirT family cytochrome c [Pelagicoccus sp. SDUM812003]